MVFQTACGFFPVLQGLFKNITYEMRGSWKIKDHTIVHLCTHGVPIAKLFLEVFKCPISTVLGKVVIIRTPGMPPCVQYHQRPTFASGAVITCNRIHRRRRSIHYFGLIAVNPSLILIRTAVGLVVC